MARVGAALSTVCRRIRHQVLVFQLVPGRVSRARIARGLRGERKREEEMEKMEGKHTAGQEEKAWGKWGVCG